MDIARALGLQPTTVRTIHGNAEKIKLCAQSVTPLAATKKGGTGPFTTEI